MLPVGVGYLCPALFWLFNCPAFYYCLECQYHKKICVASVAFEPIEMTKEFHHFDFAIPWEHREKGMWVVVVVIE